MMKRRTLDLTPLPVIVTAEEAAALMSRRLREDVTGSTGSRRKYLNR